MPPSLPVCSISFGGSASEPDPELATSLTGFAATGLPGANSDRNLWLLVRLHGNANFKADGAQVVFAIQIRTV